MLYRPHHLIHIDNATLKPLIKQNPTWNLKTPQICKNWHMCIADHPYPYLKCLNIPLARGYTSVSWIFGSIFPLDGHQKSSSNSSSNFSLTILEFALKGMFMVWGFCDEASPVSESRVRSMIAGSILVITWLSESSRLKLRRLIFPVRRGLKKSLTSSLL